MSSISIPKEVWGMVAAFSANPSTLSQVSKELKGAASSSFASIAAVYKKSPFLIDSVKRAEAQQDKSRFVRAVYEDVMKEANKTYPSYLYLKHEPRPVQDPLDPVRMSAIAEMTWAGGLDAFFQQMLVQDGSYMKFRDLMMLKANVLERAREIKKWMSENSIMLARVQEIKFSGCHLKIIPPEIALFPHLRSLDLSRNKLTLLPSALGTLSALQCLDLGSNHLVSLPKEMGGLSRLQVLCLNDNQLKRLPETLLQCRELRTLTLHDNPLEALPVEIGELPHLQRYSYQIASSSSSMRK